MYWKREAPPDETNKPLSHAVLGREDQAVPYPTCRTSAQQQVTPPISTAATRKEQWIQNQARETCCATRPDSKASDRKATPQRRDGRSRTGELATG